MKAYFVAQDKNVNITKLTWENIICLSHDKETCVQSRDQFAPGALVLLVEMDDKDVVNSVASCLFGNSCEVKCKVLEVVN